MTYPNHYRAQEIFDRAVIQGLVTLIIVLPLSIIILPIVLGIIMGWPGLIIGVILSIALPLWWYNSHLSRAVERAYPEA